MLHHPADSSRVSVGIPGENGKLELLISEQQMPASVTERNRGRGICNITPCGFSYYMSRVRRIQYKCTNLLFYRGRLVGDRLGLDFVEILYS